MNNNLKKNQNGLNDVVKAKIKGLGLEALFHQVDISEKDQQPTKTKPEHYHDEEHQLIRKLKTAAPFPQKHKTIKQFLAFVKTLLAQRTANKIILDIGTSSIKISFLSYKNDTLTLHNVSLITIPHIVTSTEEKLNKFIEESLKSIISGPAFKPSFITTLLPRNMAIVKFITLPTGQPEEIKKMIEFEADQHLPFPLIELELDYHIVAKEPQQTKLILIAVKKEVLAKHIALLKNIGIKPDTIEISSIALYNGVSAQAPEQGLIAQVHIGAAYTDINIIQNKILSFSRSIQWGSKNLTQALSTGLNINFDDAEKIKKENGIILIKKSINATEKIISGTSSAWADELINEIKRTVESFQLNSGITHIAQVLLGGGGSRLSNLNEYLRDRLRTKIVTVKPPAGITITPSIDTYEKYSLEFFPTLGLICGKKTSGQIELNLLPEKIKYSLELQRQQFKKKIIISACAAAGFLLFVLPSLLLIARNSRIHALDAQLLKIEPQLAELKDLKDKIETINDYVSLKNSCMEILRELSIIIPYDITINSFAFEKNESVLLRGIAESHTSVVNFSKTINESSFFENAKIIYSRKKDIPEKEIVDFEIFCGLKSTGGK